METRRGLLKDLAEDLSDTTIDIFIGSASFEARSMSVLRHLERVPIGLAIIGNNTTYRDAVGHNLASIHKDFSGRITDLIVCSDDPALSAEHILTAVRQGLSGPGKSIVVDITTFTRETLLMLLFCLAQEMRYEDRIRFVYASAKEYSVGDGSEHKWLSKGIREVRSVIGYPGRLYPGLRTHLIVLVGFEYQRALDLVRLCEPTVVSLGVSDRTEKGTLPHHETNLRIHTELRRNLGRVETFTFRTYDVDATKIALSQQIRNHSGYNTVIAPLNTKTSTLGAGLLGLKDETLQLCYAPANLYNVKGYSVPGDDYYLFSPVAFP